MRRVDGLLNVVYRRKKPTVSERKHRIQGYHEALNSIPIQIQPTREEIHREESPLQTDQAESEDDQAQESYVGGSSNNNDGDGSGVGDGDGDGHGDNGDKKSSSSAGDRLFIPHLFPSFKNHIAYSVWHENDRRFIKVISHVNKLLEWNFVPKKKSRQFRSFFRNTGILGIREFSFKTPDKNIINIFVERWHPETNSFHLPFGEMTITLDDVRCLTRLRIDGAPVLVGPDAKKIKSGDICRLLGVSYDVAKNGVSGAMWGSIKLEWLRKNFKSGVYSANENVYTCTARAYALYVFWCALFADKTGTWVNFDWLHYMEDMTKFKNYAWGAATLAHLKRQLGQASKSSTKQMSGYTSLLEAWINARLPSLVRPTTNPNYIFLNPIAMKWVASTTGASLEKLKALRERIDVLTATEFIWNPYKNERSHWSLLDVTFYRVIIGAHDVCEPHMPDWVMRQFGYVQSIPGQPIVEKLKREGKSDKEVKKLWRAMAYFFTNWKHNILANDYFTRYVHPVWETSDDFSEWYVQNFWKTVCNPKFRAYDGVTQIRETDNHMFVQLSAINSEIQPILRWWEAGDPSIYLEEAMSALSRVHELIRGEGTPPPPPCDPSCRSYVGPSSYVPSPVSDV